ncbi:MAG: hypothetical protein ACO3C4_01735 [Candidatus Limnocylindrus sp.]
MAVTYSYKVNGVRVVAEGGLADVVKEVEVTVSGADGAAKFELPVAVKLGEADASAFTDFPSLTEAQIVGWVEDDPSLEGTKAHIAYVVKKEAAKLAMESKKLPWAPAPEPDPAP